MPTAVFSTGKDEDDPTMTADSRELYFNLDGDIYVATRSCPSEDWSDPQRIEALNSSAFQSNPTVSPDGLTIWFNIREPTPSIFMAQRASRSADWSTPMPVPELQVDEVGGITDDGALLLVAGDGGTPCGLKLMRRSTSDDSWILHRALDELPPDACEGRLSPDGRLIAFRVVGDLFVTRRTSLTDPFGPAQPLDSLNTTDEGESDPEMSFGLRYVIFSRKPNAASLRQLFESRR